ncbi:hypothetical protein RYX36_033801, partial [Vicia faba]
SLLEDVENEYGYRYDGPLWLPCEVDLFNEAVVEIESAVGCNFRVSRSSLSCRSNLSCAANYQIL